MFRTGPRLSGRTSHNTMPIGWAGRRTRLGINGKFCTATLTPCARRTNELRLGREETVFLRVTVQAKLDHNVFLIMDHTHSRTQLMSSKEEEKTVKSLLDF